MSRPTRFLAALLGVSLAMPALAERPLSFREALESALEANPTIARSRSEIDAADASVRAARGFLDPNLGANVDYSRRQNRGFFQGFPFDSVSSTWDFGVGLNSTLPTGTTVDLSTGLNYNNSTFKTTFDPNLPPTEAVQDAFVSQMRVSLRQPLLRGIAIGWNMQSITRARDGLTVAELSYEQSRQDVLAQAASAYWSWAYQVELVDIAERQVEVATEALRVGRLRLESGEIAPVERTRLEAALVQAEQELLTARITASQTADSLLLLMGAQPGQEVRPSTPIGDVPPLKIDVAAAVEVALAQNLDVAVQRSRVDTARAEVTYAKHALLPLLSATASAGVGSQAETLGTSVGGLFGDESFPFVAVGGELSVPLGNRAARGSAQRTSATLQQAELVLQELERSVRGQVEHQVRVLQQASRRVELADINLRLAEETLAAEEALERVGRAIQRDVLSARAERFRAEVEAAKARADYRVAQTELLRLQGQIDLALP